MMELGQLRAFVQVIDQGGFTAAARHMGVSQSTLSAQIGRLEDALDLMLFDRSGRGAVLTDAGEVLAPRARALLRDAWSIESELMSSVREGCVELRIGAIPTVSGFLMASVIEGLVERMPRIRVSFEEAPTEDLVRMIETGSIHGALMARVGSVGKLEQRVIGEERLVLAGAKGDGVFERGCLDLEDIRKRGIISLDEVHCLGEQTRNWCLDRGLEGSIRCRATQLGTMMTLIEDGVGISLVPEMVMATSGDGKLRYREARPECPTRTIVLCSKPGAALPGAMKDVEALAKARMGALLESARGMIGGA